MRATTKFRQLLREPGAIMAPGASDVLSGKMIAEAGFKTVWAGGFMSSAANLGMPDANVITLTEHAAYARNLAFASGLPVIVDCDNGYGNAINVKRTVREMEAAAVASVFIEDQHIPKRCALYPGNRPIIPMDEAVGKIRAAVDARVDPDLVIIARTDAFSSGAGLEEAIARGNAYADAGADMVIAISKKFENLKNFAKAWSKPIPLAIAPTLFPSVTLKELESLGFKLIIQPLMIAQAQVKATREALAELKRGGCPSGYSDRMCTFEELMNVAGVPQVAEEEAKYLPAGTVLADKVFA